MALTPPGNEKFIAAQLPDTVRQRAASLGAEGTQWLHDLPEIVATLAKDWQLQLGTVFNSGSESLAVAVTDSRGSPAVIKVGLPGSADLNTEALVYQFAAGRGYAQLFAHAPEQNALLMERLGKPLADQGFASNEQIRVVCATLRQAWRPIDQAGGLAQTLVQTLMSGADKAHWLADFIQRNWSDSTPVTKRTRDQVLQFCANRASAYTRERSVLVHGDAHNYNTLVSSASAYKLIDPDGLCAEPACDLAALMRDWNEELLAGNTVELAINRCHLLSTLCNVEAQAIWEWGSIERVSTALVMLQLGMRRDADLWLQVSDHLAAVHEVF